MPQTSQDILELDMYDVYLLINVCSKNGMRRNSVGSAGSEGVHDIIFSVDNRNSHNYATKRKPLNVSTVYAQAAVGLHETPIRLT